MLFVIPFLVGLGGVDLFVVSSSCLMVFRLGYLLAKRRFYSKREFFKETFNRLTWLSFNMLYAVYWVLQKMDLDPTQEGLATLLNGLGLGSVLIIVIGIGGETLFVLIDFMLWAGRKIMELVRKCRRRNKVTEEATGKEETSTASKEKREKEKEPFNCKVEDISEESHSEIRPRLQAYRDYFFPLSRELRVQAKARTRRDLVLENL